MELAEPMAPLSLPVLNAAGMVATGLRAVSPVFVLLKGLLAVRPLAAYFGRCPPCSQGCSRGVPAGGSALWCTGGFVRRENRKEGADERAVRGRSSKPPWPRVMRRQSRGCMRSVHRGKRRPGIELRKQIIRDADAVIPSGRPHRVRRIRRAAHGSRAVIDPAYARTLPPREPGGPTDAH